jgi:UDP-2-acetamido-2-deoxy-ribo-hexuluronate aminotransferase
MQKIKMIDLVAEYKLQKPQLESKLINVLEKANYIRGEEVTLFENELAKYLQVKHVISCGNGTDALQIALMSLDVKNGDQVILPAFAYVAVIEVVCLLGAQPILVDVEDTYFQLKPELVEKAITAKTKAIIPVHLFGQCGNMEELLRISNQYQIPIIEDTAQALGAKYNFTVRTKFLGTIGEIGCTSFFPTKNLSCFGDGGALFTNNDELAKKIRMMANHGQEKKYEHSLVGVNSRLDTLQATVLLHKLSNLDHQLTKKQEIAQKYLDELGDLSEIQLPKVYPFSHHTWHQFTIQVSEHKRDLLKEFLKDKGVESMIYYPKSLHQQTAYHQFQVYSPIAESLSKRVLSLPIHSLLSKPDVSYIAKCIKDFFNV